MTMAIDTADIVRFISSATELVDFNILKRALGVTSPDEIHRLKQQVKDLMADNTLRYTHESGRSAIRVSYDRPVCVSPHVVLKPDNCEYLPASGQYVISLIKGAAFGGGEHPTTRLCIQLIDACLCSENVFPFRETLSCLDIGTGSGVLAIVAARIGVKSVLAIDHSPCAIHEARQNVCENDMEEKIHINNQSADTVSGRYGLIIANLRMPTLISLSPAVGKIVEVPGHLVFSGIKTEETALIADAYRQEGFFPKKTLSEKGWSAIWMFKEALI